MPRGYGASADFSPSNSGGGRDTGSDYGQFDRAVSRSANNPSPSASSGNGGNNNYQDRIQRISTGVEPGYTPTSSQPFGLSPEQAYREGKITVDQYQEAQQSQDVAQIEDQPNLIEKAIDLYSKYGLLPNALKLGGSLLESLFGPRVPSTGNVGPAGIKTDGTYGTVEDAIRASQRNEPLTQDQRNVINAIIPYAPYAITDTTPQESIVNEYFENLNIEDSSLSSKLETDYNIAKDRVNSVLNFTPVSSQFGYSTDPYGGLLASNLQTNPFNIEYLQTRGLI